MRIFTEQAIKEYAETYPDAKVALQEWTTIVKKSEWTCFADVKKTFNSVDNVGNQHYVFNIKGINYRLIVVIKFTIKYQKYHSTPKSNRIPKGYIYLSNGWITVDKILTFTIIFVAIFVIIWLCIYISIRIKIARINKIFS